MASPARHDVVDRDLVNEVGGSTDLAAWAAVPDLDAAPLVDLARGGSQRGGLTL